MACLDNEKFWGAPMATRAVIWTLLPGAGDGKPEPYATMKESMQIGEKKGVRLAHALICCWLHKQVVMMQNLEMHSVHMLLQQGKINLQTLNLD